MVRRRWSLSCLVWLVGCATGGGGGSGKPLNAFPSKAELAEVASTPTAQASIAADLVGVPDWKLDIAAQRAKRPEAELLAVLTPNAKVTPAFECVAHELARLALRTPTKRPDLGVHRFVAARCGALVSTSAFQFWPVQAPAQVSDEALVAELRPKLQTLDATATQAGAALVREGTNGILLVTFGTPTVETEPFSQLVTMDGVLEIRGRVLFDSDQLQGFINQGELGVAPCELDAAVAAPAFSLRCTLAPKDDFAWVQLMATPRGHVLGQDVLNVLAVRRADAAEEYAPRALGPAHPVASTSDVAPAVLTLVNDIRKRAGSAALVASDQQNRTAASLALTFFSALLTSRSTAQPVVDRIALGLLAGWDVRGGTIRTGNLAASLIVSSLDAERWLADELERPLGRRVLLDPTARVLSLGAAVQKEPVVLAGIAVTYSFFEEEKTPNELAMHVLERLARVRQARGLGRTIFVRDSPGVAEELARIQQRKSAPPDALHALMLKLSASVGHPVSGLVWETQNLDAIEFPKELLQKGNLTLGAAVTHYRAQGGAWGQYVVLFMVIQVPRGTKV